MPHEVGHAVLGADQGRALALDRATRTRINGRLAPQRLRLTDGPLPSILDAVIGQRPTRDRNPVIETQ
ncbi:MAG: hypothetical protein ABI333_10420 [bacterium]